MTMRRRRLLGGLLVAILGSSPAVAAQVALPPDIEAAAMNHLRRQQPADSGPPVLYDVVEQDIDDDGVAEAVLLFGYQIGSSRNRAHTRHVVAFWPTSTGVRVSGTLEVGRTGHQMPTGLRLDAGGLVLSGDRWLVGDPVCCPTGTYEQRLVFEGATPTIAGQDEPVGSFHTPPSLWRESRLYHTPFDAANADRIELERIARRPLEHVARSSNGAYGVGLIPAGRCGVAEQGADCQVDASEVTVAISIERDYLLALRLRDHYRNFSISLRWTNEKLLFVRLWWGRILGTDLVLDVESERIVFQEMVNDGSLAFRQFRNSRPDR